MTLSPHGIVSLAFSIELVILSLFNLLALYIMLLNRELRRHFHDYLLMALFVSHLVCAIMNLAFMGMILAKSFEGIDYVWKVRDGTAGFEFVFTILISIDRYFAIRRPFFYARLRKSHAILFVSLSMIAPILFGIWRFFSDVVYYIACLIAVLCGVFISISSILLYRSVKKQCEGIAKTIVETSDKTRKSSKNDLRRRKLKSLKICIYIAASYLFTWIPLITVSAVQLLFQFSGLYPFGFQIVGFSNGIWDVLIYFYFNQRARLKLLKVFRGYRVNMPNR